MSSPRHRARQTAVQALYQWLLTGADPEQISQQFAEQPEFLKLDITLFRRLLAGVPREAAAIEARLAPYCDRPVAELSPVERAVLLLGGFELIHSIDVPYRVVINEAVELTKTFGGTDGHKYVNGVLDKLAAEARALEMQGAARSRPGS